MKRLLTLACAALLACAGFGCVQTESRTASLDMVGQDGSKGFMFRTISRGIHTRKYGLFIPMTYKPSRKYPVIIFLHGIGESQGLGVGDGKNMTVGLGPSVASQKDIFPFICIFPQCDGSWNPNSAYAEDVIAALDDVCANYSVDQDRVTLTGTSIGGYGAYVIGSKYYDRFASVVALCSNQVDYNAVANLTKLPVRAYVSESGDMFAGDNDRDMVLAIAAQGGNAEFIPTPTVGHNCWDYVYSRPELFAWISQQRRKPSNIASAKNTKPSAPISTPAFEPAAGSPLATPLRPETNLIFPATTY